MQPEVLSLIRLQDFDQSLARLTAELLELPKRLDTLTKDGAAHGKHLESLQASLKADETERRKLEGSVVLHKSKIIKLKKQLNEAQTQTQSQAFEHEITWAESEIVKAEERELELLMEEEQLRGDVQVAKVRLLEMQKTFELERTQALTRHKAGKAEMAALEEQRQTTLKTLEPTVTSLYERLRRKHKNGIVAAEVVNSQCQACYMEIRPQMWQELRTSQPFMTCENCSRVLYITTVTGFDPQFGPAPAR